MSAAAPLPRALDQRSGGPTVGRPPVNADIRALVTRMTAANPVGRTQNPWQTAELGLEVLSAPSPG
jgi:hypothetical protein